MENLRLYGAPPYRIAVIHGGPGAPGEMAPVARALSRQSGVLEPLQTALSLEGQVLELNRVLIENAAGPVTLIGHSWGAILGFILAAMTPALAEQLIMVGAGVFDERYAGGIMKTRLERLTPAKRSTVAFLLEVLARNDDKGKDQAFTRLGSLLYKADCYDPLLLDNEVIGGNFAIFRNVWDEAAAMRKSGELLALAPRIRCPVIAIHGSYDPHPAQGVQILSGLVPDFRFILLDKCGHYPWVERYACKEFYRLLRGLV
jgi:pimeloyl-ACP methyl ester carboxylesterase